MSSPFSRGRPKIWRERDTMKALPHVWGAYRFREERGIAYIGITSNIYNRISQHRSTQAYYDPEIHIIEFQEAQLGVHWNSMCSWEKEKIFKHSPHLVTYIGGNGRRPAIEVNGEVIELREDESVEDTLTRLGMFNRIGDFMSNLLR